MSTVSKKCRQQVEALVLPLAVRDLTVAYHRKPVVWDIDLEIPEGKLVSIVGPN